MSNLEWCTAKENQRHAWNIGNKIVKRGKDNHRSKEVIDLETGIRYESGKDAAIALGINPSNMKELLRIKNGINRKGYKTKNEERFKYISEL